MQEIFYYFEIGTPRKLSLQELSLFLSLFQILALGNQVGRTFVWDLDVMDPTRSQYTILSHPKCTTAIRQTALSRDGSVLLCVCDDGTIWRWDKIV